jgi:hypothetical protein
MFVPCLFVLQAFFPGMARGVILPLVAAAAGSNRQRHGNAKPGAPKEEGKGFCTLAFFRP